MASPILQERTFVVRDGTIRDRLVLHLNNLLLPFQAVVGPVHTQRSLEQNSRLWALHSLASEYTGYSKDDLHEIILCEWAGYNEIKVGGQVKRVPLKRSSNLDKKEFRELVEFTDAFYAKEFGIWLEPGGQE